MSAIPSECDTNVCSNQAWLMQVGAKGNRLSRVPLSSDSSLRMVSCSQRTTSVSGPEKSALTWQLNSVSRRIASYGSLARFRDIQRLVPLESTKSSSTCLAVGGDMSDFQYLQRQLESMMQVHFSSVPAFSALADLAICPLLPFLRSTESASVHRPWVTIIRHSAQSKSMSTCRI